VTAVVIALIVIYVIVGIGAYALGRIAADSDAALERMREQRRHERLARDIEESIAAFNSRPLGNVGEVIPIRRRDNSNGAA
jgi:biopolymer transport protein ExbB/TolQ